MEKKDIVVVIPIYKATLTQYEEMSLNQCVKVLANYSLVVIKPTSLDINELLSQYSLLKVENFPDDCFSNLRAYNKLVLSEDFYQIGQSEGTIILALRGCRNDWKGRWAMANVFC